jgi:hypothetical protein
MKKFKVHHLDRNATYVYYIEKNDNINKYVLTILYYHKIGSWKKEEDVVLSFKTENFFGDDKEEVITQVKEWISNKLGRNFTIQKVDDNEVH